MIVFVPIIVLAGSIGFYQIKQFLQANIENELNATISSLYSIIKTTAHTSIKNRLSAIAEKNFSIAEYYYSKHRSGLMTLEEAVQTIEEIFLNQHIGISGYIYCLNSKGDVIIHPNDKVKGTNVSDYEFVKRQIEIKDGYIEYEWKNPDESDERPKVLYMIYYKPLDWIISVSAYKEDFKHLVDIEDFRDIVLSFKTGASGYSYFLDEEGNALIHPVPQIQGTDLLAYGGQPYEFVQKIISQKNGKLKYTWQNPGESSPREKIVFFKHLPEYQWIICSSSYIEEIYSPLNTFTIQFFAAVALVLGISIFLTYSVSRSVTRPLETLIKKLEGDSQGDFSVRMNYDAPDELGKLSTHFDRFMDRLQTYHDRLNNEINKTRKAQEALVENDLKLRGLFNQSFQYTGILSPNGILEEINQSALDFAGTENTDVLYKPAWETLWWADHAQAREKMKKAVHRAMEGSLARLEISVPLGEGEESHCDISIKPVFNNSGQIEFMILEGRDISALKLTEQERRQMAVQLEKAQKMEAIGTLAGGIAHDFNNILSSIFGYSQLAEMNLSNPEAAKKHIAQIVNGAQRAASLVQQILTFSRQTDFKKQPLKIHLILKEALKLLRSSIPTTIDIEVDISSKAMVLADATKMHQVIMNLCTNAYQSMVDTGGILSVALQEKKISQPVSIGVKTLFPGDYLEMSIKDTGHGMDKATLEKAFDPYFTTKEVGKGTGFGLTLVQAIVEEHEGLIHAESVPGKGSCFIIFLPTVQAEERPSLPRKNPLPENGTETVMVVDDEEAIRQLSRELLEDFGYRVFTFTNGEEALAAFEKSPELFDLVITDMTMPRMTGDDLARELNRIRKDIPIILCTGYNESISEAKALDMGIDKFLLKPIENNELLFQIRKILDDIGSEDKAQI